MTNDIQVVAIGNSFELVYDIPLPYSKLTRLAKADESHFGQKATFWTTRYGFPNVVVCTSRPSLALLDRIYESRAHPIFIEPQRETSSICADLLRDKCALRALLSVLDRSKCVFLAPYVHTANCEMLAELLARAGYKVVDYRNQASLVKSLWSKTEAQRLVFDPVDILRTHRPKSIMSASRETLVSSIMQFKSIGIGTVVVKSAAAVGGSGVFYVQTNEISKNSTPEDFLLASGQNEPNRVSPFIIEECVPWDLSPTVDIDISMEGCIDFVGIALQRLHDRRYYNGFYSSTLLDRRWWFKGVESIAKAVGLKLFELGYTGPANIDFVVSSEDQRITLIEVNPRRSALIDGYGLHKLRYASVADISISATDYVNISNQFDSLNNAFDLLSSNPLQTAEVLPVSDGGFSTSYRWVGVLAIAHYPADSEDILAEAVSKIQDPDRDETGSAGGQQRTFSRVQDAA